MRGIGRCKSNRKVIVYLANLANTKFGYSPSSVPLEIGYIKAYAVSRLSDEVDIQLYRTFESFCEAIQIKPGLDHKFLG